MSSRTSSSAHGHRSSIAPSQHRQRQLAHLNAQLAKLNANLTDLDGHLRVTAVQADSIKKLGAMQGALLYDCQGHIFDANGSMAASQVLGEDEFEQKEG
jgi:hypothetical protein